MFKVARGFLHRLTRRPPAPPGRDDRRAWPRRPAADQPVVVAGGNLSEPRTARVLDVSRAGLRLLLDRPLDPGTVLHVELPPRPGATPATILATVFHVAAREGGGWSVGCQFATELGDDDWQLTGARSPPAQPADEAPRCQARVQAADRTGPVLPAAIHNISPVGVALRLGQRTEPGALVALELVGPAGGTVSILGSAVYVAETPPGQWLTVCNFVRPLSDAELQLLG